MRLVKQIKERILVEMRVAETAENLADKCFEAVWGRVQSQVLGMSPAEAHGYVWARAGHVLQVAVADAVGRPHERLYALTMLATMDRVGNRCRRLEDRQQRRAA